MEQEFRHGDNAWVYWGNNHNGKLTKVKVILKFRDDDSIVDQYVVRLDTAVEPVYSVYSTDAMSDSENQPIGLYRDLADSIRKNKGL